VEVKGILKEYRGSKQLIVNALNKIKRNKGTDLSAYIKTTSKDIGMMFEEVTDLVGSIENRYLKELLELFMEDDTFVESYKTSTAAVKYHHAYRGGLLEHSLNVAKICDRMTGIYDNVNRDLLIAGAILHDVGKIREYLSGVNLAITNRGRLLGHITMGYGWVLEKIRQVKGFPEDLSDRLLHIILSHHGHLKFGSPKRPMILEAFIVYHADHLDGDIGGFNIIMENTSHENDWSDYVRNFERPVYVRQLELAEESDSRSSNTENREREISKDKGQAPEDTDQEGLF
jgi:3'-5' exoribonuclease